MAIALNHVDIAGIKLFKLLVNGEDLDTGDYEYYPFTDKMITDFKETYKVINSLKKGLEVPDAKNYVVARYPIADEQVNLRAMEAAYKASQIYRYFPVSVRRKIMFDMHENLMDAKQEIIELLVAEGHPKKLAEWEFYGMEKGCRIESVNFFKDQLWAELGRIDKETIYIARKPDGVVCVIPPKNAPCSNSLIASYALLGGNAIIVKPPHRSPLSTIYLWREVVWKAAKDNGAPPGTINIIVGNAKAIADGWIASPYVNDIIYFGTSENGIEMGSRIYMAGKKPILELSGNDMMFVWKDADIAKATDALLDAFLGSTQICMVPKAAVIHGDLYDSFVKRFSAAVGKLKVGLPSDPDTCLTPVMKIKEFYEFLEDALAKGAVLLRGGERVDHTGKPDKNGSYITPAILAVDYGKNAMEMNCVIREENFFPLLPLMKVTGRSDEEIFQIMMKVANSNEYGLRTSVWMRSSYYIRKFVRYLHNSGLLRINSRHVDFSLFLSTHGGTGKTGGPYGEMNYIWQKTTHLQGISLTRDRMPEKR